jgi:ribosome-binding factor A
VGTSHRSQKVADRIKVVVAGLLEGKIKDPRLGFVTVTHASIFYTVLGDDEQRESTAAALESAKGVIRSSVGKDLGVRVTPSIEFFLDGLPESALALDSLLAKVREQDAEVSKLRKEANYAGEQDAYKAPKIIDNSNKPAPVDRITNWDDV